jgi:quinol monooxygenase YgiN
VSELQGIARFKIHEGKLEEFKRLSAQCMEIVRSKDTGRRRASRTPAQGSLGEGHTRW